MKTLFVDFTVAFLPFIFTVNNTQFNRKQIEYILYTKKKGW